MNLEVLSLKQQATGEYRRNVKKNVVPQGTSGRITGSHLASQSGTSETPRKRSFIDGIDHVTGSQTVRRVGTVAGGINKANESSICTFPAASIVIICIRTYFFRLSATAGQIQAMILSPFRVCNICRSALSFKTGKERLLLDIRFPPSSVVPHIHRTTVLRSSESNK